MELMRATAIGLALAGACGALPAAAQDAQEAVATARPAVGTALFYSTDSDDSTTMRAAIDFDLRHESDQKRLGFRLEQAWYDPVDSGTRKRERAFVRWADGNDRWKWSTMVGTDGHTVIGTASIHDEARFRKELFVERDVIETRRGLDERLYATFGGAAIDLPAGERTTFTVLAGLQEFTGDNVRLHARANAVHVVDPDLGLSAQLRTRWFRNSDPREFDYYSPRWYAQVLPVLQVRRFVDGWELVGAGGIGAQRDSDSEWGQARFAQVRVNSPSGSANDLVVRGELTYTNAPATSAVSGPGYSYFQAALGLTKRF